MKIRIGNSGAVLAFALMLPAAPDVSSQDIKRFPDGTNQTEAILKSEHEKSLRDVAEILKLAEELKAELEKNQHHVLSVGSVKKAEDIEKLAKEIKGRLKRVW